MYCFENLLQLGGSVAMWRLVCAPVSGLNISISISLQLQAVVSNLILLKITWCDCTRTDSKILKFVYNNRIFFSQVYNCLKLLSQFGANHSVMHVRLFAQHQIEPVVACRLITRTSNLSSVNAIISRLLMLFLGKLQSNMHTAWRLIAA